MMIGGVLLEKLIIKLDVRTKDIGQKMCGQMAMCGQV